ncbi:hypothetical protein RQP46_010257 [Phenoliferia psychrophenolica]
MEHHPEAIHLYHSLGALDAHSFERGTQVDHPTPAFSRLILLALYPSPWEDIRGAFESLVSPTGRGIDESKIVGGKMGMRLVWQALGRATGIQGQWDEDDIAHWCRRLSTAIDAWLCRAVANVPPPLATTAASTTTTDEDTKYQQQQPPQQVVVSQANTPPVYQPAIAIPTFTSVSSSEATCHLPPSLAAAMQVPHIPTPSALLSSINLDFLRHGGRGKPYGPDFGTGNARFVGVHFCISPLTNFGPTSPGAPFIAIADPITLAKWRDLVDEKGPGGIAAFMSERTNAWQYRGHYRESHRGAVTSSELNALSVKGRGMWGELLAAHYAREKNKPKSASKATYMQNWGFQSLSAGGAMLEIEAMQPVAISYSVYMCVGYDGPALAGWVENRRKRLEITEAMEEKE